MLLTIAGFQGSASCRPTFTNDSDHFCHRGIPGWIYRAGSSVYSLRFRSCCYCNMHCLPLPFVHSD